MIEAVDLGAENDERMARLREALALGTGFQLVIVQAEPGEQREEVLRRLAGWSGRNGVPPLELVRLAAGESPLIRLAGGHAGVILVGLEAEGHDRAERMRQMVTELNWSRDRLPELVRGPLVLVVSQRVQSELFEQAPDFYSWRTHSTSITPQLRALGDSLPLHLLDIAESDPGDLDALGAMIARTEALRPQPLRELGLLYARLAGARSRRGEQAAVDAALDAAYQAYSRAGTPDDRVNVLLLRGEVARRRGRTDEASAWMDRARREARAVSPTPSVVVKLRLFEVLLEKDRGHYEVAALAARSAIEAAREMGDARMEASAVFALAHLLLEKERSHYEVAASVAIEAAMGDVRMEASAVFARAHLGHRHADVAALLRRARDLARQAEEPILEANVLQVLASVAAARGRSDDAEVYGREAVTRAEVSGSADAILRARAGLAQIALTHDDLDLADRMLRVVVSGAGALATGQAAEARAALARRRSDDAGAERHLREALEAYRRGGDTSRVARVSLDLAQLGARTGNWALALTGFETADALGDSQQRALAAFGLAKLAFDREEWTAALADQLAGATKMLAAAGDATRADVARGYRGLVLRQLGHEAEARAEWTTALAGFETRGQVEQASHLRELLTGPGTRRD